MTIVLELYRRKWGRIANYQYPIAIVEIDETSTSARLLRRRSTQEIFFSLVRHLGSRRWCAAVWVLLWGSPIIPNDFVVFRHFKNCPLPSSSSQRHQSREQPEDGKIWSTSVKFNFVNLKSNSALKSNNGHNLLKSVFPSNNSKVHLYISSFISVF